MFIQELKELMEKYEVSIDVDEGYDYQGMYINSIDINYTEDGHNRTLEVKGSCINPNDIMEKS